MIFSNLQAWADAGLGNPDAQLALSEEALVAGQEGRVSPLEALVTAETLARLAMVSGADPARYGQLAGVLYCRHDLAASEGDDERAWAYEMEATGLLVMADEEGCTQAGDLLATWAHLLRPDTLAILAENKAAFLSPAPYGDCS